MRSTMSSSHSPQAFVSPLERLAAALGGPLSPAALQLLCAYLADVALWNEQIDLTAARTADAMSEVLVADALVLARPGLIATGARLLDVGTGAGGPAIPLLILRPDLHATLVEPLQKRVTFLRQTLEMLSLSPRTRIIDKKLDRKKPKLDTEIDVAMSRATFAPDLWLSIGTRLAPHTLVLTVQPEPPPLPKGVSLEQTVVYQLPFNGAPRAIQSCRRG